MIAELYKKFAQSRVKGKMCDAMGCANDAIGLVQYIDVYGGVWFSYFCQEHKYRVPDGFKEPYGAKRGIV